VVLGALGRRASRERIAPIPAEPPDRFPPPVRDAQFPPRPAHPLEPLVAAVGARLSELGVPRPAFAILDGVAAPIVGYEHAICFAGENPRLRALAASITAPSRSTAASTLAALDALVAHVVCVLNAALTSVTDATEAHALGALLGARNETRDPPLDPTRDRGPP
jgi:hypothetical protein